MGVSARTSAGVYDTDEPAGDQRALTLPLEPPLLRPPPLLPGEEYVGESTKGANTRGSYFSHGTRHNGYHTQGTPLQLPLSDALLLVLCISPCH